MENFKNEQLLKEIKPKFNVIYELFMPTGRKMKSALIMALISIIVTIIVYIGDSSLFKTTQNIISSFDMLDILKCFCWFMVIFSIIKFFVHFTFQKLQYEHISYKFYETYMIYEDDFLNQHKKNILYSNIKEVEIRRTIWDRILGFGVIILYTNAENKRSNGLVVYALDNPKEQYEFIDNLINKYRSSSQNLTTQNKIQEENNVNNNIITTSNTTTINDNNNISNSNNENIDILEEDKIREQNEDNFKNSLKETN